MRKGFKVWGYTRKIRGFRQRGYIPPFNDVLVENATDDRVVLERLRNRVFGKVLVVVLPVLSPSPILCS